MSRSAFKPLLALAVVLLLNLFITPQRSEAVSIPIDQYLEGDPGSIPFFPVGTIDITDLGGDTVRFDLTPIAALKFDNLGLGLAASVDKFQLVLTALTADEMELNTGGWLGFPIVINFNDKPAHAVSFQLSGPGLDISDFFVPPASKKFPDTVFGLRYWFMSEDDILDTTAGGNTAVPEPATSALLATGLLVAAGCRRFRAGRR